MVERFNRRLGEHLGRMPQNRAAHHRRFLDHACERPIRVYDTSKGMVALSLSPMTRSITFIRAPY
jgi:hypothetical protein